MGRFKRFLSDFSLHIIVGLTISIVVSGGLGVLAWVRKLDGLYIAIIVIGVLCLSVVLINQFDAFFDRRKKPLYKQNNSYIDFTLRDWLYKRGFSVRDNPREGFDFALIAKDKQERPVLVGKLSNSDEILLDTKLNLKKEDTEKLDKLNGVRKRELISELRISLARNQVEYYDVKIPLKGMGISYKLVLDSSFTRDAFLEKANRVRYSLVLVSELISPILEGLEGIELGVNGGDS